MGGRGRVGEVEITLRGGTQFDFSFVVMVYHPVSHQPERV